MLFVHTLGTARIDFGETHITPKADRKFSLLLYLAAEAGRRVPRATLSDLLYPGQPDKKAHHALGQLAYRCRRLGVDSNVDGILLDTVRVCTDYGTLFNTERLDSAQLTAIAGGFLPGYTSEHSEAFTEWLDGFRSRTTVGLLQAAVREVKRAREVNDWTATEAAARACFALDPLNDEATFGRAEMLARNGAKAQAIKLIDRYLRDIGNTSRELRVPAVVLKRRISEHPAELYVSQDVSPFVGRDAEMRVLREHLARARGGSNECVAVIGEAGIGKSRLVKEFSTAAVFDGASVAMATSLPHDVHRPFGGFADLLPRLLTMRGALGCAPASLRALKRLTKAPTGDAASFADTVRNSDALCDSLVHAILDLVDAIAGEQLLVLAVEDVHWLDGMSLRVLGYLLSRHRTRRLLVLVTSRGPAPVAEISRYADTVRLLEIGGLASAAIERLASAFSVQTEIALDGEMTQWLESTSTGNPLFLESLLAYYARTRERFVVSPTLSNLLSRRVELLSPHAATTLQICALLGKHATLDTLMAALSLSRSELIRAVGELEAARLIKSDKDQVHPAHALIADVAQARLNPIERRLAHQCVALALETRLTQDRSVDVVWECAEHWVAAHDSARALAALRRCATQALEVGRPGEAAQILARALSLEVGPDDRRLIGKQMVLAGDAAGEAAIVFQGYEALGTDEGVPQHDDLELAHFRACLRSWHETKGKEEDLFGCISASNASPDHRVVAAMSITQYADLHGNRDLAQRAMSALSTDVLHAASRMVRLQFLLVRHCVLGEWDQAVEAARALIRLSQLGEATSQLILGNAALVLLRCGCHSEAVDVGKLAYANAMAAGNRRLAHQRALSLSEIFFDLGSEPLGRDWHNRAIGLQKDDPGHDGDLSQRLCYLVRAIDDNNSRSARQIFDRMTARGLLAGSAMQDRWNSVLGIRLRQLEGGRATSDDEVESLMRGGASTPHTEAVREIEISTACRGIMQMGRRTEARQILDEYVRSGRVTRCPLSKGLQDLRRELASD